MKTKMMVNCGVPTKPSFLGELNVEGGSQGVWNLTRRALSPRIRLFSVRPRLRELW